jgi:alkylhydroperoxidase family enzyme
VLRHGRAPWPRPDELDGARRELYEAIVGGPRAAESAFALVDPDGRLEGPFNAMLISPALGSAVQSVGAAIRYHASLTDREREIAILALAAARRSSFEWYAHERVGRRVGLTDTELAALLEATSPSTFTPAERTVHEATQALVSRRDLDDEQYDAAMTNLGLEKVGELVTLVGYYDHLALALEVWRTPLPAGTESPFDPIGQDS